jgi:hypothetical protein
MAEECAGQSLEQGLGKVKFSLSVGGTGVGEDKPSESLPKQSRNCAGCKPHAGIG